MGEKKKNNNNNEGGDKKKGGDGEKKPITVVLKIDMDCDGCASKIVKCVRAFDGVETVKADTDANKVTVTGNVDPSKIREKLHQKTKKKVDLISPQPKKEDNNNKKNDNKNDNNNNNNKDSKQDKKPDDKKPKEKEVPVTTAVLKLNLHCQGCVDKIHKTVHKFKGVHEHSIDKQKDLVTVKGTMDVKALVEILKERLKKPVEVVPPKKEKDGGGGGAKVDKLEYVTQPGYGYEYGYGYGYPIGYPAGYPTGYEFPVQSHAPQMFSDENPNACSIM